MGSFHYYSYSPSQGAAIVALALFFLTTVLHTFQLFRTRNWYWIPFVTGGFLEWIGYVARVVNAYQTPDWSKPPFIVMTLFLLIAPAWFAASMYMLFGRIILVLDGNSLSIVKQKYLTALFVCGDILAFILQAIAGILITQDDQDKITKGQKFAEAGLIVQVVSFGFFIITALTFHWRILRRPTAVSASNRVPWRKHMYILYATSALIFLRCVIRVVEYFQGVQGYLLTHEVFLYVFDTLPMLVVMVLFNVVHPSEVSAMLKGAGRIAWKGKLQPEAVHLSSYRCGEEGGAGALPALGA